MLIDPASDRAKGFFWLAAAWNLSAAAIALFASAHHTASFFGPGAKVEGLIAQMNTQLWWVSVLLFGVGYAIVALDPRRNHGIVFLAALGKTYVGLLWVWSFTRDEVTVLGLAGGLGDLAFAAVFAIFLWQARAAR